MTFAIRPYHPSDLTAVYRICLLTGDRGGEGCHLFSDPDLLGHYFAAPYAVLEPDLAFILTKGSKPCGYVLGTKDTATFGQRCEQEWFPPLRAHYALPAEENRSRDAWIICAIHRGHDQTNALPDYPAHLHIDLLPEGQGQGWGRKLLERLLREMKNLAVPGVHLGVGKNNLNAIGFYEHVGFQKLEERDTYTVYGMKLD